MADIYAHKYRMVCIRTGETTVTKSNLFQYDFVKQYYPDILSGEYFTGSTNRFYSPSHGYILLKCEHLF